MDKIITRLDQLIKFCSSSSNRYSECIYEIDGLALSIAGKNSDIYKNLCSVYKSIIKNKRHVDNLWQG